MILAAGRGERMRPLTDAMPKPLIPIAGRSMLDRAMARLGEHGVSDVVVNVHYLGEQIAQHLDERARIIREERLLESGGSVKNALPLLGDGPFFVLNGDGLWQDGRIPMLARMEAAWDPARMNALLLLHPLDKTIGREARDRGDYFLGPDGPFSLLKLWNRAEAAGRLYGLLHDGQWFHVGTPQALGDAERALQ